MSFVGPGDSDIDISGMIQIVVASYLISVYCVISLLSFMPSPTVVGRKHDVSGRVSVGSSIIHSQLFCVMQSLFGGQISVWRAAQ